MSKGIVIITGGASGLGFELVKQFIEKSYFVCNIDRDSEKMKILANTYKDNYKGFIGDISDSKFVKDAIDEISNLGNIKILINNAGEPSFRLPTKYEKEDIDKCFKGLQGMILFSTEILKVAYKGTSVKVIGVYPGGINTEFYKNSRDYVSEEK